jgi:hypothetical protein
MSWDACLIDDRGHWEGDWNFTHNTSPMIYAVLEDVGITLPENERGIISWWAHLDGMSGPEGAAYLDTIIRGLLSDPERFRMLNPPNGWGDYGSLVKVLTAMRDAVPEWPTTWSAGG